MELVTVTDSAIEFMNGIIPAGMIVEEIAEIVPPKPEPLRMSMRQAGNIPPDELTDKIVAGEIVIIDE